MEQHYNLDRKDVSKTQKRFLQPNSVHSKRKKSSGKQHNSENYKKYYNIQNAKSLDISLADVQYTEVWLFLKE